MMRKFTLLTALAFCLMHVNTTAQETGWLYVDDVYYEIDVTENIEYGQNYTILTLAVPGVEAPTLKSLQFDFYEPANDDESRDRPLIIMFHASNFLPYTLNGTTVGSRKDNVNVELATRLARKGYAVAVASYRLGWNPQAPTQPERAQSIIQAAYRGVQDARTAVRFFKRDVHENGNQFRVDTTRITLWGVGTGGYLSTIAATLDDYLKISNTTSPPGKFLTTNPIPPPDLIPMVLQPYLGDIYGWGFPAPSDTIAINESNYPGPPLDIGDTLLVPNHLDFNSDFDLAVNMGGAIGDISWLEAGDVPIINYHLPTDPSDPYYTGLIRIGELNIPVVEVQGGAAIAERANELGNHDVFEGVAERFPEYDEFQAITAQAEANSLKANGDYGPHPYYEGLYPFIVEDTVQSSPWNWWDPEFWSAIPAVEPECGDNAHECSLKSNPDMSPEKGKRYVDTIMWYFIPRAFLALDLPEIEVVSTEPLLEPQRVELGVWPNPAADRLMIRTAVEHPMQALQLFDINGKLLRSLNGLETNQLELQRSELAPGMYVLKIYFEEGVVAKKVLFR